MDNIKYLNINDLNKNYYCLLNNYVLIYNNNIWKTINIGINDNEYQQIFNNLFEYCPILKSLQFFKKYIYPFQIITKYDNPIIYYNNKYHHRECLLNLFLNSLTYYIINYQQDKLNDYYNILKNNIICSILREYDKNLDYNKIKNKKETLDRIYFKKDFLNDLTDLNLNIKFGFKNINCYPFIKKLNIFNSNSNSSYTLDNDKMIIFSILKNKKCIDCLNDFSKFKIDNIIIKNNKNKYIFVKTNEKFKGSLFFEDIIIDFPDKTIKNIKLPTTINIIPSKNILSSSSITPSKHSSDLSSDETITSSKNNDKIKLNDIHNKLTVIKPIDDIKNNKLLIKTIGNTLNDDDDLIDIDDEELTTASSSITSTSSTPLTSTSLISDKDINNSIKFKNIKIEDEQFIPLNINEEKNKEKINEEEINEEEIIYEDKEEERKKIINDMKYKIKELNELINNLELNY